MKTVLEIFTNRSPFFVCKFELLGSDRAPDHLDRSPLRT